MGIEVIALSIVAGIVELLKQSKESGQPLTREQLDKVISDRRAAEAENAALDPKDGQQLL